MVKVSHTELSHRWLRNVAASHPKGPACGGREISGVSQKVGSWKQESKNLLYPKQSEQKSKRRWCHKKPFFSLISQWSQFSHESLIRISRRMDVGFQWTKKWCFHRYSCHQVDVIFRGFHPPGHRGCLVDALSAVPTSGDQESRSKWWECKPPHRHKQHVAFSWGHLGRCNEIYTQSPKNPGSEGSQPAGTKRASLAGLRVVCWDSLKMEGFFLLHKKSIQAARADFWGHQISQVCTLDVLVGDIVDLPPVFREVKTDWKTMESWPSWCFQLQSIPKPIRFWKLFEAWQSEAKKTSCGKQKRKFPTSLLPTNRHPLSQAIHPRPGHVGWCFQCMTLKIHGIFLEAVWGSGGCPDKWSSGSQGQDLHILC